MGLARGGRSIDILDRRTSIYGHHSSSSSKRHHHSHHHNHPYSRGEYFLEDVKKVKSPTFDGEMKKSEDAEAWLLGMKKLFRLHSYSQNMKANIVTFILKGKAKYLVGRCEECQGNSGRIVDLG